MASVKVLITLASLVFFFSAILAQDLSVFASGTTELKGADSNLVSLSDKASFEINADFSLAPTASELVGIKAMAATQLAAIFAQVDAATVATLATVKASLEATISAKMTTYSTWKAQAVADLNANLTLWNARVANYTAKASVAVNKFNSDKDRLIAVLEFHVVKLDEKVTAAAITIGRLQGAAAELNYKVALGFVILLNNTIAMQSSTALGMSWTVMSTTELKANITALFVAEQIVEFKIQKLRDILIQIRADIQATIQENKEREDNFRAEHYHDAEEVKANFEANMTKYETEISVRTQEFVENTNSTTTDVVTNANGTVTIKLDIIRDDAGTASATAKAYIEDHVQVLIAAIAGVATANVTVHVTATAQIGAKRAAQNSYTTEATIGPDNGTPDSADAVELMPPGVMVFAGSVGIVFLSMINSLFIA